MELSRLFLTEERIAEIQRKFENNESLKHKIKLHSTSHKIKLEFYQTSTLKIVVNFIKNSGEWVIEKISIFKRRIKRWVLLLTLVISITGQMLFRHSIRCEQPQELISTVQIEYSSNSSSNSLELSNVIATLRGGLDNLESNLSLDEDNQNNMYDPLVKNTIQKSKKQKWPKSINKLFKGTCNLVLKIYHNTFARTMLGVVEASIRNPPSRINVNYRLVQINPTSRNLFPPGTYSNYQSSLKMERENSKMDEQNTKLRRQPPLESITIKDYHRAGKVSIGQIIRKRYHYSAILRAFDLPNNHLNQFKNDTDRALEVIRLLKKHCVDKSTLIRKNGILNKRERVIHVFNPKTRLYVAFEDWPGKMTYT